MTGHEDWIVRTALKILQDIDDVSYYDIQKYLKALGYIELPNDEDESIMKECNLLFVDLYDKIPNLPIENFDRMWIEWKVSPEIACQMKDKAYKILCDQKLMSQVRAVCDETIKRSDDFFKLFCLRL